MFSFIYLLRMLGAILITNSHFDDLYPIAALGTGGAIGNGLFFFASGFTIKHFEKTFLKWYGHRIKKIYISIFVWMTLLCIAFKTLENYPNKFFAFIKLFIYPTQMWFISCLLVLYILLYIFRKYIIPRIGWKYSFLIILGIYIIAYILLPGKDGYVVEANNCFKWIYYFLIMLLGAYGNECVQQEKINPKITLISSCISLLCFYSFKLITPHFPVLWYFQFILQLSVLIFSICFGMFLFSQENKIKEKNWIKIAKFISPMTLEIYMVQDIIIKRFAIQFVFPINIIIAIILIICIAFALSKVRDLFDLLISRMILNLGKGKKDEH